jgi:hypothetical protein
MSKIQDEFNAHIDKIVETKVITSEEGDSLKSDMVSLYNNDEKYKFIEATKTQLTELISVDNKLKEISDKLDNNDIYQDETRKSWKSMMNNLGKLQTLIFIKDGRRVNCNEVTKQIIDALDEKIKAVNEVIAENLKQTGENLTQTAGNIKSYKHKYLKYKSKYLRIKNNM